MGPTPWRLAIVCHFGRASFAITGRGDASWGCAAWRVGALRALGGGVEAPWGTHYCSVGGVGEKPLWRAAQGHVGHP